VAGFFLKEHTWQSGLNSEGKSDLASPPAQPPRSCAKHRPNEKMEAGDIVYVVYRDHVHYHRSDPALMEPQVRETVGWLECQNENFITLSWDRDACPPTLIGGDPKASGLVILRSDIIDFKKVNGTKTRSLSP
jgi:hypothetical protein